MKAYAIIILFLVLLLAACLAVIIRQAGELAAVEDVLRDTRSELQRLRDVLAAGTSHRRSKGGGGCKS